MATKQALPEFHGRLGNFGNLRMKRGSKQEKLPGARNSWQLSCQVKSSVNFG